MKSQLFRERRYRFAIALILCISLCVSPMNAFALDSISTEPMLPIPTAEEAAASVSAISYSISPNHLYPFIYDGTAPSSWREIDTTNCVTNRLYVYNSNTDQVTPIGEATVTGFTTTQDQLFYVTADQQIIQTDYTGTNHTPLYHAASGEIIDLDYFNGVLNFIEGGNRAVLLDVASRQAATVLNQEGLCSLFFFDDDKFIWRDPSYEPFYYNISTREGKGFDNEHELNCFLAPYITPSFFQSGEEYYTNTYFTENDVDFPLPEYNAPMHSYHGAYPSVLTYFNNGDNTKPLCNHPQTYKCRQYGNSRQCDGFAIYAHERYAHVDSAVNTAPYRIAGDTDYAEHKINYNEEALREQFLGLSKGAYIRYGRINCAACRDTDPCRCKNLDTCVCTGQAACGSGADKCECTQAHDHTCEEQHSAVFVGIINSGAWIYECNHDSKCGVFYEYYTFEQISDRYHCITTIVDHDFTGSTCIESGTRHKLMCKTSNCTGYLSQAHTGTVYATAMDGAQHYVRTSCCAGDMNEAHTFSYGECTVCGYS